MEVIGYHVAHFIAIECRVGSDALTLTAPPACTFGLDGRTPRLWPLQSFRCEYSISYRLNRAQCTNIRYSTKYGVRREYSNTEDSKSQYKGMAFDTKIIKVTYYNCLK